MLQASLLSYQVKTEREESICHLFSLLNVRSDTSGYTPT